MGSDWPARYTRWDVRRYGRNVCRETAVAATVSSTHNFCSRFLCCTVHALPQGIILYMHLFFSCSRANIWYHLGQSHFGYLSLSQFKFYLHSKGEEVLAAHQDGGKSVHVMYDHWEHLMKS